MIKQRLLVRFTKRGDLRFISHADLLRLLSRAARRAGLPVALSEGYNPRPRISMPLALGLGWESQDELAEFGLAEWTQPRAFGEALDRSLPGEVQVTATTLASPRRKCRVVGCRSRVEVPPHDDLAERAERLMEAETAVVIRRREKKTKEFDVRPFLVALSTEGGTTVTMEIENTDRGTARPDEVVEALGIARERIEMIVKLATREEGSNN